MAPRARCIARGATFPRTLPLVTGNSKPAVPWRDANLSPDWRRGFEFVEAQLGGSIVGYEAQPRWRPAWFLEVDVGGEIVPIYWRGDRGHQDGSAGQDILSYEANIFRVLEGNGLPVPHIYAVCEDPKGIVMDHCAGRANLATARDDSERAAVLDHFMELLAQMHAIDVEQFERQGMKRPADDRAIALGNFEQWLSQFRKQKLRPEPWIEFVARWVQRNIPDGREEVTFVSNDSGQFLFEQGRVTALLDMELGTLGDPLADLGGLWGRDLSEPLGDLSRGLRHYAEVSGREVDLDVVRFHTVRFQLFTPLSLAHFVAGAQPGIDLAQYHAWHIVWGRTALEAMAQILRIELPGVDIPPEQNSVRAPEHDALAEMLTQLYEEAGDDVNRAYQIDRPRRLALYLQHVDRLGAAFDEQEREELGSILGRPIRDLANADRDLEALVLEAEPHRDAELLSYFYRRLLREQELYRPALKEISDVRLQSMG